MHFTNSLRFVLVCGVQRWQAIALLSVPSGRTFTIFPGQGKETVLGRAVGSRYW